MEKSQARLTAAASPSLARGVGSGHGPGGKAPEGGKGVLGWLGVRQEAAGSLRTDRAD